MSVPTLTQDALSLSYTLSEILILFIGSHNMPLPLR